MDYLEFFSNSDELTKIFSDAYRDSIEEENKISLFKLYYSWKHYVGKKILDELRFKLGLDRLKEKLLRERPEIIEKYDNYNEEIEKKRREIQIQEFEKQNVNGKSNSNNNSIINSNNNYINNSNNSLNLNYNQTQNLNNNFYLNKISNNNNNTFSNNLNQTLPNKNNTKLNLNFIKKQPSTNLSNQQDQVINILQNKAQSIINSGLNNFPNLNNISTNNLTNNILLGKGNMNQSLLPSITKTKDKNKEADHLFSSASSENSEDEKTFQHSFMKKKIIREAEIDRENKAMKDVPIKKRKIEEMQSDISSNPDINLTTINPNRNQFVANQINTPQINLHNPNSTGNNFPNINSGILPTSSQQQTNITPLNAMTLNNPNFHITNIGNNPNFNTRANLGFPNQQIMFPPAQGNIQNIQSAMGYNYLSHPLPKIPNINQMVAAGNRGAPFPPLGPINPQLNPAAQQGNIFIHTGQNITNLLGHPPGTGISTGNLIPRADHSFKNLPMIDNINQFGNIIANQSNGRIPLGVTVDGQNIQNINDSGINYLNSFISKSNVHLDYKSPFFSSLAKWFYESISEDNPLNEIKKDNKKIKSVFDLLKIKDFTEKESYKDLFKKVLNSLYSDIKNICSICGYRTSQYRNFVNHLDIHFHTNYIKKTSQKRELYRREACSKSSWITNTDSNLNLANANILSSSKNDNLNILSSLNAVLYYLSDSDIHLNSNKNNINTNDSESNENMIFPVQDKVIRCIYCKEEFKKKYFTKFHYWFYINVNKLNFEELKTLSQNNTAASMELCGNNFGKVLNSIDEETGEVILIHNTCLEEFVNLLLVNNKKNIEQIYMKVN